MQKHLLALSCASFLFLASCQKDVASKTNVTISSAASDKVAALQSHFTAADSTATWYGSYAGYYGPYPAVAENDFIKNGFAKDPAIDLPFSYSNISLDIPPAYNISGDSIIFEVVAKNPAAGSFYDYDIVLQLIGEEHSAELHFVSSTATQQYTQCYVGNKGFFGRPELVQYFPTYKTIRFALKKDRAGAAVDTMQIGGFNYGAENRIGRLKTINVAGKGFVYVNSVTLVNSQNNNPVLYEDFNIEGKSHTIFY